MHLCGTPLNETILVLRYIAEEFKKATRVEVLNTIILTDGDASYGFNVNNPNRPTETTRMIVEDDATKYQQELGRYRYMTDNLLTLYKKITGSRIIGLYLISGKNFKGEIYRKASYSSNFDDVKFGIQYREQFSKHKFFSINKMQGYDAYYMVPGKSLEIENITMSSVLQNSNANKNNILKAFKKMQNTKMISRVFLNQFIAQVS
jgi:hypothetical protein